MYIVSNTIPAGKLFSCHYILPSARPQGNLHWGGIQLLFIIRTGSMGPNKKYKVMRPQIYINLATWLCEGRHLWFEDINLIMRGEVISEYKLMRPQIYIDLITWLCEGRLMWHEDINLLPHGLVSIQYFLISQEVVRIHRPSLVVTVKGWHIHLLS